MNWIFLRKRSRPFFKRFCEDWCRYRHEGNCVIPIYKKCPIIDYDQQPDVIQRKFEKIQSMWEDDHEYD